MTKPRPPSPSLSPFSDAAGPTRVKSASGRGPVVRAVPAITKGVAILRLLARSPEPLGVNAMARQLGIVPSTCLHILRALVAEGLVTVEPASKRYLLDAGMLTLARSALRQDGFARSAEPLLDELAATFAVTAIGVRVIGLEHMIVVAMSRSDAAFRLHVDVGSRFPALISATGRCLAAFGGYTEAEIEPAFAALHWDDAPSLAAWRRQVAETRRTGLGIDGGNYIRGVTVLAAPVLGRGSTMTHALVAVALTEQLRAGSLADIGAQLQAASARISELLGVGANDR